MQENIKQIKLSQGWVQYELTQKNIKNLNLHFTRQGVLKISAPTKVKMERIEAFIRQNEEFIFAAQKRLAAKKVLDDNWLKRGFIYWQGEKLPLVVEMAESNYLAWQDGALVFYTKEDDEAKRKQIFKRLFDVESEKLIMAVFERIYPSFAACGIAKPQVKLRKMTARWGSCSKSKGVIIFNKRLAHLPKECIECVAAHELTHLLVPNHSAEFYQRLQQFRPAYRDEEKILLEYICQ